MTRDGKRYTWSCSGGYGGNYHLPACLGLGVSCVASGVAFLPYVAMVILLLFF